MIDEMQSSWTKWYTEMEKKLLGPHTCILQIVAQKDRLIILKPIM